MMLLRPGSTLFPYTTLFRSGGEVRRPHPGRAAPGHRARPRPHVQRSEEHTSELQSPDHLVCRLLLEKKNATSPTPYACSLLVINVSKYDISQTIYPDKLLTQ